MSDCQRCGGTEKLRSGADCPDCTHNLSWRSTPTGRWSFCSCGWRHFETKRQNALGRASKERAAARRHFEEVAARSPLPRWRVTTTAPGFPPVTAEVEAADQWKARTRAMADYPHPLRGEIVEHQVEEIAR